MARQHRSLRLQTRDARAKLTPRAEPYWYDIERGRAIGYYGGSRCGSWWLREFSDGAYRKRTIGRADDRNDADGDRILSFSDAIRIALRNRNEDLGGEPDRRAVRCDLTVQQKRGSLFTAAQAALDRLHAAECRRKWL